MTSRTAPLDASLPEAPTRAGGRSTEGRGWCVGLLLDVALLLAAALAALPRHPQPLAYHLFADQRAWLGVPHAADVLSNLAFAAVGLTGLGGLLGRRAPHGGAGRLPWLAFFAAVALVSLGSAWYHLAPDNDRLVWDRLPMAMGFMALFAALVAERIDGRAGRWLLAPLTGLGLWSVLAWHLSERAGRGDLRPYLFVQFFPLLAVPLVLLLFPRAAPRASGWLLGFGAYALAKVLEAHDGAVYAATGVVSGHTLKHLAAAAGIGALAWMVAARRRPAGVPGDGPDGAGVARPPHGPAAR